MQRSLITAGAPNSSFAFHLNDVSSNCSVHCMCSTLTLWEGSHLSKRLCHLNADKLILLSLYELNEAQHTEVTFRVHFSYQTSEIVSRCTLTASIKHLMLGGIFDEVNDGRFFLSTKDLFPPLPHKKKKKNPRLPPQTRTQHLEQIENMSVAGRKKSVLCCELETYQD